MNKAAHPGKGTLVLPALSSRSTPGILTKCGEHRVGPQTLEQPLSDFGRSGGPPQQTHSHTRTHSHILTHTHTHTHTHSLSHTHSHTLSHTHSHKHSHTHSHSRAHTHIHTLRARLGKREGRTPNTPRNILQDTGKCFQQALCVAQVGPLQGPLDPGPLT